MSRLKLIFISTAVVSTLFNVVCFADTKYKTAPAPKAKGMIGRYDWKMHERVDNAIESECKKILADAKDSGLACQACAKIAMSHPEVKEAHCATAYHVLVTYKGDSSATLAVTMRVVKPGDPVWK